MKTFFTIVLLVIVQFNVKAQLTKFILSYGVGINAIDVGVGEGGGQHNGLLIAGTKTLNIWTTKYSNLGIEPNLNIGLLRSIDDGANASSYGPVFTGDLQAVFRLRFKKIVAGIGAGTGFLISSKFTEGYELGLSLRGGYQINKNWLLEGHITVLSNSTAGGMASAGLKLFKLF